MTFDWYKRDSGAWLQIEQQLTLEQVGALNTLADFMHKLSQPLVDDGRICGLLHITPNKWTPMRAKLIEVGALVSDGAVLDCPLLIQARNDRATIGATRRQAGSKGGARSALSRKNNGLVEANAKARRGELCLVGTIDACGFDFRRGLVERSGVD
jgi:hypothetical protein